MADYVVAQAAVLIVPTTKGFRKDLEAQLKKIQLEMGPVEVEARLDSKKMLAEGLAAKKYLEKDPVNVKFRIVDATKQITEIRHKYEDMARQVKKGLLLNLKVVGLSLLPQLVQGIAAVNASMVELTRTAVALPGILAGALSSFATLATGLSGVKAAFKEYKDAQKNAAQEGLKARNSAINVQNAYRDLGRSIKDAKRNLEDLNAELRNAPLDEADAIIRVAEAQADAADKAGKSGLQQQKDLLALKRAENDLADVRLRNSRLIQDVADANAKGVAGADSVREATERLSKAQDEANTQATKLTDSLKELSPNAQKAAKAFANLDSKWQILKSATQDRLFAGLDAEITRLGEVSLPTLQKGFGAIADSLNGNVKAAFRELGSQSNLGFFDKIFSDTAAAQQNLSGVFDPLVDSLLRLSAAGTDFLPRLVDGLVDLTTRFDNFIVKAKSDGSLDDWINKGIDEFKALGNSVLNLGSVLNSISEAFTGSGGKTFLQTLEEGTKGLSEFLKSDTGQDRLKTFFTEAREELEMWKPLLQRLPELMANLAQAGQQWANMLMPFLRSAASVLAEHPGLVQVIFTAYMGWKGIFPVLKGVYSGIEALNKGLALFRAGTDETGKKIDSGLKAKFTTLTSTILSGGGLLAAVTTLATFISVDLAAAHADAENAARRQREELDKLVGSLDAVTGAATGATRAKVGENLINATNEVTGQKFPDLGKMLSDPTAYVDAVAAGNIDAALALIPAKATPQDVQSYDGGKFWNDNRDSLEKAGLTPQIIADAINGKPDAVKKFEDWQYNEMDRKAPPWVHDRATLNWYENRGLISETTDLADLQNSLTDQAKQGAALSGETYAYIGGMNQGRQDIQNQNRYAFGRFSVIPSSMLAKFGPIGEPSTNDGKNFGLVTTSAPQPNSAEFEQFRNDGVTFEPSAVNGQFIVSMGAEAANKYLQRMAAGGLISGPGSGTSDSILARLSNGEYVVNASATQKHLPLLESINGGKLPGYAPGGEVNQPEIPSILDKPLIPIDSSGSVPASGNRPGQFGGSFQSAGQAQAARRGINTSAATDPNASTGILGRAAGAVKSAVGSVGSYFSDAYANSAWATMTAPLPEKPPPNVPSDPNAPKSIRDFYSQLFGTPVVSSGPAKPVPFAPGSPVSAPVSGGTVPTSTDSRVNPNTSVHGASGAMSSPGPGNAVPNIASPSNMPAAPGPTVPYAPLATGPMPGIPGIAPTQVEPVPGVTPEVNFGATEAARYGLHVSSGLRPGETRSYHSTGQAGDYSNQKQFGPPTPEMTAFANDVIARYTPYISELIYSGVSQNIIDGKLVPAIDMPGSPYNTGQAGYHGDHVHIAWKPGVLEQLTASAGSPSNMPMAMTPTGVALPQLTYTGSGASSNNSDSSGSGLRLPTPEEYAKYVADSWMGTLQNLVQNAGQIAMNFVGSFFGIDLSKITGLANSAISGIDLPGSKDSKSSGSGSNLPGLAEIDQIIAASQQLPPQYQQSYVDAASKNPAQAGEMLQQLLQSFGATAGSTPSGGDIQGWLYGQLLSNGLTADQARGILAMNAVEGGAKDVKSLLGFTESQAQGPQAHVAAFMKQWNDMSRRPGGKIPGVAADGSVSDWNAYMSWIRVKIVGQTGVPSDWEGNPQPNPNDYQARLMQALATGGNFTPWNGAAWPSGQKPPGFAGGAAVDIYGQNNDWVDNNGMIWNGPTNLLPTHDALIAAQQRTKTGIYSQKFASGGKINGPGGGRSDSIIARVSNGEYIVRAPMAQKHRGLLDAINANRLPGFADGGQAINPLFPPPPPPPVPPVTTPTPPPAPVPPDPMGPQAAADAGQPIAPAPVTDNAAPGDQASTTLQEVGSAIGQVGDAISGVADGATAPAGGDPTGDPRAVMGAAPQNLDHNKPAVSAGIQAAGSAISGAINTAVQAAAAAGTFGAGAPAAGAAAGSAGGIISGLVSAGAGAVSGAVNILSSLGVGTVTPTSGTAGAYGVPLSPETAGQQPYTGPQVVNNWNGGVHTSNNEEFYKLQQRRELQNAAPFLPQR